MRGYSFCEWYIPKSSSWEPYIPLYLPHNPHDPAQAEGGRVQILWERSPTHLTEIIDMHSSAAMTQLEARITSCLFVPRHSGMNELRIVPCTDLQSLKIKGYNTCRCAYPYSGIHCHNRGEQCPFHTQNPIWDVDCICYHHLTCLNYLT